MFAQLLLPGCWCRWRGMLEVTHMVCSDERVHPSCVATCPLAQVQLFWGDVRVVSVSLHV
jgi:hypothetical protein